MAFARIGSKFRMELTREEPRMIWQFDGFNQTLTACGYAADDQTSFFQLRHIVVVDLVAVAMTFADMFATVDFAARLPGLRSTSCAPKRMVPPKSADSSRVSTLPSAVCHSSIRATTGAAHFKSNSVEFAPFKPATSRAYSIRAICMPKQMPKYGTLFSRA